MRSRCILGSAILAIGLLGAGCSPAPSSAPLPSFTVRGDLPDGEAAVAKGDGSLSLYLSDGTGTFSKVTSTLDAGGRVSVHLFSYGGDTQRETNTFVFGYAPPAAVTVEVVPGQAVAEVRHGVYVAALAARDLRPSALSWTFRDASGAVVQAGSGIID